MIARVLRCAAGKPGAWTAAILRGDRSALAGALAAVLWVGGAVWAVSR